MSFIATILSPFASKRFRTWPTRPRWTASGFSRMSVRSMDSRRDGSVWGASTIPTSRPAAARILRVRGAAASFVLLALLLPLLLLGCATDRETTLSRTARGREAGAARAERERQQRELALLRETSAETLAAIAEANAESVRRSAELRAVLDELQHQISVQQRAEQDLDEAKARGVAIEKELQPLRQLEQTLRDQERLRAEASARVASLQAEVETALRAVEQKQAELQPKLAALQQQVESMKQLEQ